MPVKSARAPSNAATMPSVVNASRNRYLVLKSNTCGIAGGKASYPGDPVR